MYLSTCFVHCYKNIIYYGKQAILLKNLVHVNNGKPLVFVKNLNDKFEFLEFYNRMIIRDSILF